MSNKIKYPISISSETNQLIHISEVSSGYNCYCFHCKKEMIAVNNPENKVAPHFKHKPGSNCVANFETYIHWLAKEILSKNLQEIELPAINSRELFYYDYAVTEMRDSILKKYNVPDEFRTFFNKSYTLQESKTEKIKSFSIEKEYITILGNIRVDFVLESDQFPLFIEPFFTNKIDGEKKKKIELLDISTISINLAPFGCPNGYDFSLMQLEAYIKSPQSKYWIYVRTAKRKKLVESFKKKLVNDITLLKDDIYKFHSVQNEIGGLEKSKDPLRRQITKISINIENKKSELKSILDKVNLPN